MLAELWVYDGCSRCEKVRRALVSHGVEVSLRCIVALEEGTDRDSDAREQFSISDYIAPVVRVNGYFMEPEEIEELIHGGQVLEGF